MDEMDDPLAEARVRGREAMADLLAEEGGVLTSCEVAARLGVNVRSVYRMRRGGRLLGIRLPNGQYRYPVWQLTERGVLPGLHDVLQSFCGMSPWARTAWFVGGNTVLEGRRPVDLLRAGDVGSVCRAAGLYGDGVAV
jgi:hypothetical protein